MAKFVAAFDVDGVLIDVSQSYHQALAETCSYFLGKPVTVEEAVSLKNGLGINNDWDATLACLLYHRSSLSWEEYRSLFSQPLTDYNQMYRLAQRQNVILPDYETVVEEFENRYRNHRQQEKLRISRSVLNRIRNEVDWLAVITGRTREDLDFSFKNFCLYDLFDVILTEDDLPSPEHRKPSAYLLEKLESETGSFHRACYVGDSLADKLMVENYNRKNKCPVYFILFRHEFNSEIESEIEAFSGEEVFEWIVKIRSG